MKKILLIVLSSLFSIAVFAQTKYPIKTIFKGDSVVILTVQQSEKINQMLEKSAMATKENRKKHKEYEDEIAKLSKIISDRMRISIVYQMYYQSVGQMDMNCLIAYGNGR